MQAAPLYEDIANAPSGGQAFFVKAEDGTRIRFALWQGGARGLALVFPGRSECVEKYGRLAGRLQERGFAVLVIDWRGQGLSDRLNNSTSVGHVDYFSDYQQDIKAALSHPDVAAIKGPRVLFAHSMGGCIGLRALLTRQDIAAAVFSAPMWGLHLPLANALLAPLLASFGVALGIGKKSVFGQPKGFYLTRAAFKGNNLTHDPEYWDYMRNQILLYPALALGPPSYIWLKSAFSEFKYFETQAMPDIPSLSFVGSDEAIVSAEAIRRLIARFPSGTHKEINAARHEIWMETPDKQQQCWSAIDAFLSTSLPEPSG